MRIISADYNRVKGRFNRYASVCVGAGRAAEALRKDFLDQLEIAAKECGFKYLRFHGIFHDDMGVYTEDREGNPKYNWQYVDIVYDAILERGMKPFVELSFMPKALASGEKTVFWWKANVTPPKDYDKWYGLVNNFVTHLEERYGREEVSTWYFEVWNEANHPNFFSGTMNEYFKMYEISVKAIRDVCSRYRVGGPATAGCQWITEFLEYCSSHKIPVDFLSTHTYGVKGDFDELGTMVLYLYEDKDAIIKSVKGVYNQVKASTANDVEIHFTEWNSSYSSRDPVHDTYIQAPYILYNLKRIEGYTNSFSYWTFTDVFEEVGPPPAPFHGGFGLINLQFLKKPAYFVYKFLNELGDEELLNTDSDSWVCRSKDGIQAIIWDYTMPQQDSCNQIYFRKKLPPAEIGPAALNIKGLGAGKYEIEVYMTGYGFNDVYTAYFKLGSPGDLKKEALKELSDSSSGSPVLREIINIGEDGDFHYTFDMRENDLYYIKLKRAN